MAETKTLRTQILLRNDSAANWKTQNPVLGKGECGIELDTNNKPIKFKFGDGKTAWKDLAYVGTSIKIEGEGDVIIGAEVNAAGELVLTKGKISADKVYFDKDITATYAFGKYAPGATGSVTIPANGKSVAGLFIDSLAEAKDPTVTQPSVSISLTGAGAKEVGSEFTPAYSVTFNKGSYQYGPDTGITATYAVSDTASHTATTATGSFEKFTVADNTNYKVSVIATHTEGAVPKNNLGAEAASKKIAAGTKSANSSNVTGYRNSFWGGVKSKTGTPDSAIIRGLAGKKGGTIGAGNTGDAQESVGDMRVIIAVPAPRTINSIKDVNGLNAEAFSAFTHITVDVEGLNGFEAKSYNVYYKDNAAACDKANKWHFTVA